MSVAIPSSLAFDLNFVHPLMMWLLLGLSGYSMVLGIRAKKTRTAPAEERKELIKGHFARRHYRLGSLVLALMVLGTFGGMAVTYLNNGKLFVSPHLLVGITMTSLIAVAAALSPLMQHGNLIARKIHVGLNMTVMTLFLWQAVTGMQIVNKILTTP
jgi:FtsH-binding integral membrane protein